MHPPIQQRCCLPNHRELYIKFVLVMLEVKFFFIILVLLLLPQSILLRFPNICYNNSCLAVHLTIVVFFSRGFFVRHVMTRKQIEWTPRNRRKGEKNSTIKTSIKTPNRKTKPIQITMSETDRKNAENWAAGPNCSTPTCPHFHLSAKESAYMTFYCLQMKE